jgi:hypothetical protein
MFHDDPFRYLSIVISRISEATMLILLMGFMKYTFEMGSGAMVYLPSFIKISSGLQTLLIGTYTGSQTAK